MKSVERIQARKLRLEGLSIKEICQQLQVAKSSVSEWVRDIRLSPEQVKRLDERITCNRAQFTYLGRIGGAKRNKEEAEKRHEVYRKQGYEQAKNDEHFRLVCALYWGEGQKSQRLFGLCNSDPAMLDVVLKWLIRMGYGDNVRFAVRYHPGNGLGEEEIKCWWQRALPDLKPKHFRKFSICSANRASQGKKVGRLPYGTALLEVCRAELYFNILGGIDYLRQKGDW